jgi:predicted RNase H-like nuclease (RuvC/YqgF family)
MQRTFLKIIAIALLTNLAAYAQSLGDIARENREKQKAQEASGVQPRMITNKDLPEEPEGYKGPREPQSDSMTANTPADHSFNEQRFGQERAAGQWQRQILTQENRMANLQVRIDQLNASLHFPGRSAQYEGPSNRYQARQMQRVEQMQQRLDEQKRILEEMQEAARHAGMHTRTYDP